MEALGCKTVADLMKVDARTLIDTAAETVALRMFPVRDGRILPLDPWKEYENGIAKDIIFLQGCNKDEMNCFVADWTVEGFKAWAADRKTKKYAQLLTDEERAKIESFCKEGAVEDWEPDSRLFGHSWFIEGAIKMSESQTKGGGKSYTYFYRVESSNPIRKSAHFEEVPVVFAHPEMIEGRQFDATFMKTMRMMWTVAPLRPGQQAGNGTRRVRHPSRQGGRREDRGLGQNLLPDQILYALIALYNYIIIHNYGTRFIRFDDYGSRSQYSV